MEILENPQLDLLNRPEINSLGPPILAYQIDGYATWPPSLPGQPPYSEHTAFGTLLLSKLDIYTMQLASCKCGIGLPEGGIVGENEFQFRVLKMVTDSILIEENVSVQVKI